MKYEFFSYYSVADNVGSLQSLLSSYWSFQLWFTLWKGWQIYSPQSYVLIVM